MFMFMDVCRIGAVRKESMFFKDLRDFIATIIIYVIVYG